MTGGPDDFPLERSNSEQARLAALRRYEILDTPREQRFDRLTKLAADIFNVPVAFVAFLDADRQWFKSTVGLDQTESSLAASFCTYTVDRGETVVIEDATQDDRFSESPFVTDVGLQFYAGTPIVTPDGYEIGTFSIMAHEPRSFSERETEQLGTLAEVATNELNLRQKTQQHERMARRFRAVLEDPNMLAGVLAPDGTLLEANETSMQYVEEDRETVLGRPFWKTPWWPERLQDTVRDWIERAADGQYVDYEADLTGPGGASYSVEGTIRPVFNADGELASLVVSARDVTERREREEMLERMRAFFAEAERLGKLGVWEFKENGEVVWTDGTHRILEVDADFQPTLESGIAFFHPDDRKRIRQVVQEALVDHSPFDVEARLITANDNQRWVRTRGEPIDKDPTTVHGFIQDITEEKEAERELRDTKRLLEKTFENLTEAVLVVDPSTRRIVMCNAAVEQIFGYKKEELIGKNTEVIHVDRTSYERFGRISERVLETEPYFHSEYQMRRKDGRVINTEHTVSLMEDDGKPIRAVSIVRDITERKRHRERLVEAKEEAERANRMKSAFLANMSHEIRTPLTSILGFAETLQEKTSSLGTSLEKTERDALNQCAHLIEKSGRRLMETLNSVFTFSKLEGGEIHLDSGPVNVAAEVQSITETYRQRAEREDIGFQVEIDDSQIWADADAEGVRVILRNLLSNALKYTKEGGQIWIRTSLDTNGAVLEIEDTGVGMDPDTVPELFEPFRQESEGVAREYEGTGLGLTVTKKMVEEMKGTIDVNTERAKGTRVVVHLPQSKEKGRSGT